MSSQEIVHSWDTIMEMAPTFAAARMFGVTLEQAAVIMAVADELQVGRAVAINGLLYCVDTPTGKKVAITAALANSLIQKSGKVKVTITDLTDDKGNPTGCTVHMVRSDNGNEYTATFTHQDAQRIHDADLKGGRKTGLLDKSNWQAYSPDMYFSRAFMKCSRRVCADIIFNLYTVEELGLDTTAEGDPLPPPPTVTVQSPAPPVVTVVPSPPPTPSALTVADILAAGFSAEQIIVANEGRIPATSEDCAAILARLQEQLHQAQGG